MNLFEILGIVVALIASFVGGVITHAVIVSTVNKVLAEVVTELNAAIAKIGKV